MIDNRRHNIDRLISLFDELKIPYEIREDGTGNKRICAKFSYAAVRDLDAIAYCKQSEEIRLASMDRRYD